MIQIIGTRKCARTRQAQRFFSERGVKTQFLDLAEKGLSPGELANIARGRDPDALIDRDSRAFGQAGLAHMIYDPLEEILKNPLLLRTPVVRNGREVTVGAEPETWKRWLG